MTPTTPAVSVLMPIHNGARYLRSAIDSVLEQTLPDFELLAIDDGSTDDTPEILAEYARHDPRVVIHRLAHAGLSTALNTGCTLARAELIARLDADDVALPRRLEHQLGFMREHEDTALVGGWMILIDDEGEAFAEDTPPTTDAELREALNSYTPFYHSAVMMRRRAVQAVGGYRPLFEPPEDYDLWLRMSERYRLANLAEVVGKYRHHPHQKSAALAELHGIGRVAVKHAARDRRAGRPERLAALDAIDADALRRMGVEETELTESVAQYATWLGETLAQAGHADAAAQLFELAAARAGSPSGSAQLRDEVERRAHAALQE